MADGPPAFTRVRPESDAAPLPPAGPVPLRPEDYREGFGEELTQTLDVTRWRGGRDLAAEYARLEAEIQAAVVREGDLERRVRAEVHPRLAWVDGAPKEAGRHAVPVSELADVHRNLLFPGAVEACDGSHAMYDTLALTVHQIGVALVSYRGEQGHWGQRLFRHDLRLDGGDPVRDALDVLERRGRRAGLHPSRRDVLSELAQRAVMSYAERAVLLRHSSAPWKMGHGSPAPYELLTGFGFGDLVVESIKVIRGLIEGHQKFVYVASEPQARHLLTIGQALRPLEYAIVCRLRDLIAPFLEDWEERLPATVDARWDGKPLTTARWVSRFRDEVASKVVVGLYRATLLAPPQLFYAHEDHSAVAVRLAMADSVLQEQRGFPQLIDLADAACKAVYGGGTFTELAGAAYAAAGAPFRYQSERATRDSK